MGGWMDGTVRYTYSTVHLTPRVILEGFAVNALQPSQACPLSHLLLRPIAPESVMPCGWLNVAFGNVEVPRNPSHPS